ncbi:MAG: hypothetical protein ACOZEN_06420 [Thermodesulfobacteriota bacterium]
MTRRSRFALALAPLLTLFAASPLLAHKVNLFAVAEKGVITGEAYFGGGGKAVNSTVEMYDASGRLAATAVTGPGGAFSLPVPEGAKPPLRLVLKAGDGHGNDFTLTAADLGQAPAADAAPPAQAAKAPAAPLEAAGAAELAASVEAAAAKVLDEKLAPVKLELARLAAREDSARMRDVVGGIGWIVGLVGIAAWFKRPGK